MLDHNDDNRAKSGLNTDKHSNRAGFLILVIYNFQKFKSL